MMSPMRSCLTLLFVLLRITELARRIDASSDAAGPSATPREMQRTRRERTGSSDDDDDAPCLQTITTALIADASSAISAHGILFTVSSPPSSSGQRNDELTISSLGFYVDADEVRSADGPVTYEVRTLAGHYADPDRTNGGNGGLPLDPSWDFRGGDSDERWETIAEGSVRATNLTVWPPDDGPANYFRIPFDAFQSTSIEGEGVRSFYVTLKEVGALMYAPLDGWEDLHDAQNVWYCGDALTGASRAADAAGCIPGNTVNGKPILHIGEGVVSYPFPPLGYFYQPRRFMGSIYYLGECWTHSPTIAPTTSSPSWSGAPSPPPTVAETASPSQSQRPSPLPRPPQSISLPTTSDYIDAQSDGCHTLITTDRKYESFMDKKSVSTSYGIVFPMESHKNDEDGVWITSLGFHVDFAAIPPSLDESRDHAVNYEVYALIEDGLYADHRRTPGGIPKRYDYRGNFSLWENISMGKINKGDLVSNTNDYFQIPWSQFEPTFIPAHGGKRSFYLTLNEPVFVYKSLSTNNLGNLHKDDDYKNQRDQTPEPPLLLYGEGIIGYPFRSVPFLYSPKQFIGRVFYEYTCPSQSPSVAPSMKPSESPSSHPTSSESPSSQPTSKPTYQPSNKPSSSPSGSPSSSSHPSNKPSPSPSGSPSVRPSSRPSFNPTVSHEPTDLPTDSPTASPSLRPSFHPSNKPSPSPSDSPSIRPSSHPSNKPSPSPSGSPSIRPSSMPSFNPTVSHEPTDLPTDSPSASRSPSNEPSSGPTESFQPTRLHFPSLSPSISITPSESPSYHPTFTPMPSKSLDPSSLPSLAPSSPAPCISCSMLGVTSFGALLLVLFHRISS